MRKRIMIIGAQGSGKSSIANWLNGTKRPLKKKQDAIYGECTIDVPAQYLENVSMYRYILTLAQTACCVLFLEDAQAQETFYPPNFAASFNCPVIGLVTGASKSEDSSTAAAFLQTAGVKEMIVLECFSSRASVKLRERLLGFLT
ncbi:EutP/PduV family microcompartment system protein [Candidatus Enterococcus clewellii]|uniref:Ethanolamine utilization protein EutP n=1 Tax=Candidatus Enterococcus clewellii TaxID=1834193 RepID=A0A242KDT0_9ENTE|nr:EutP/PduV family microcompartment system protein [Enterococcus sp. 9E7_DIV0242]OTP18700.1 hypothetical protein A5888_000514 [Enterococcus sp. 9E7_DIV0242]